MSEVELLPTGKFLTALRNDLSRHDVKDVTLSFFYLRAGRQLDVFYPLLLEILRNGGKVHLKLDAVYSGMTLPSSILTGLNPFKKQQKGLSQLEKITLQTIEEFKKAGGVVSYVNTPKFLAKLFPFYKRDHRKNIVIRDSTGEIISVYTGSCNIYEDDNHEVGVPVEEWLDRYDLMLRVTNKEDGELIAATTAMCNDKLPKQNLCLSTVFGKFHLSSGIGVSDIRKQLVTYINQTTSGDEVYLANQMPIDPFIARCLVKAAKRGVTINVIIPNENHEQVGKFPYSFAQKVIEFMTERHGIKMVKLNEERWFTHSKAVYIKLGSREIAYTGSENIAVLQGILLKTVDDGVITEKPELVEKVRDLLRDLAQ